MLLILLSFLITLKKRISKNQCFRTKNYIIYIQGCLGFIPCLKDDILSSKTLQSDVLIRDADGQRFIHFGNTFLHEYINGSKPLYSVG